MRFFAAVGGTVDLIPVAAFCQFGFTATPEPAGQPDVFVAFRVDHVSFGLGWLPAIVFLIAHGLRTQPDRTPCRHSRTCEPSRVPIRFASSFLRWQFGTRSAGATILPEATSGRFFGWINGRFGNIVTVTRKLEDQNFADTLYVDS